MEKGECLGGVPFFLGCARGGIYIDYFKMRRMEKKKKIAAIPKVIRKTADK